MKKNTYEVVLIANEDVYAIFKNDFLFMKFAEGVEAEEAHEVCERLTSRAVDGYRRLLAWASELPYNLLAWLRGITRHAGNANR